MLDALASTSSTTMLTDQTCALTAVSLILHVLLTQFDDAIVRPTLYWLVRDNVDIYKRQVVAVDGGGGGDGAGSNSKARRL